MAVADTPHAGEASEFGDDSLQLCCFFLGDLLCGIDICWVQEINRNLSLTQVPLAPEYVMGIMNLRGRIVTVINLGRKLGLTPGTLGGRSRVIIVNHREEYIGLLVDRIDDVLTIDSRDIAPPPANMEDRKGKYFTGACKKGHELISILDVEAVLVEE
ncbi:MAG: chemotaxis protein CheW [Deltaproteobacteria bacterium]|nr:chemotaxis protein CheW [Deltaproteobacteria bacterium]